MKEQTGTNNRDKKPRSGVQGENNAGWAEWARIGILLDRKTAERRWSFGLNVFTSYVGEVLSHRGIAFHWINDARHFSNADFDIIIIAATEENSESAEKLWQFAEQGGVVVSFAGLNVLASRFGYKRGAAIGAGYAVWEDEPPAALPLRFMNAEPWVRAQELSAESPVHEFGTLKKEPGSGERLGALLQRFAIGLGSIERFAVDIPDTIVQLQQGSLPLFEDGIPAPDGTAGINDGVLKADDQYALDWQFDRIVTETGLPYCAYPYADLWRVELVGYLLRRAAQCRLAIPFIGYWPDGISHVGLISHDSDYNQDEHAWTTLDILRKVGIRSTWCMLETGYSPDVYDQVRKDGHELAFHYNAVQADQGVWSEEEFVRQLQWMKEATDCNEITSNKNHLTRMEGWGEFFKWCERSRIASDQSRGPSKKGNIGFLFGTCQPYFPIAWADEQNRFYDVLQLGFLSPDIDHGKWADSSIITPILEQVRKVQGVAHFVFHQIHLHRSETVRSAFYRVIREAKERGFSFWTGQEINDWVRWRRKLSLTNLIGEIISAKDEAVKARNTNASADMNTNTNDDRLSVAGKPVVYIPMIKGETYAGVVEQHYGLACRKVILSEQTGEGA